MFIEREKFVWRGEEMRRNFFLKKSLNTTVGKNSKSHYNTNVIL